jgi:transposase-like protein
MVRGFNNRAKRIWWSIHVEAWKRSGLPIGVYCGEHRLPRDTFSKWRDALAASEDLKTALNLRRKKAYRPLSREKRLKATQAFWAMHVEAWQWSGLALREYAATHRLSSHSLKRWRNMIDADDLAIDWRTMLHPSALPLVSTKISTRTKNKDAIARLTAAIEADAPPAKRARRRRFTTEQKIALLLQVEEHGETVSSVGRAHGISTSVLFRWRDQLGFGKEKPAVLTPVRVVEGKAKAGALPPSLLADLLPKPEGMVEVELADGRLVFAPQDAAPEAVRRAVAEQEARP